MPTLPDVVVKAWDEADPIMVFATKDSEGVPNVVYVTCVKLIAEDAIAIADNKFHKTRENISAESRGALLFITPSKKAYQIKGSLEYHTSGSVFEAMKNDWLDPKKPGIATVVLKVESVYSGAEQLL